MGVSSVTQTQVHVQTTEPIRPVADFASDGFESAMAAVKATDGAKPGGSSGFDVTREFKQQLKDVAKNESEFNQLLDTVFGPGVNRDAATRLRTQVLNNDFSFLPEHQFVDRGLGTANGVFDEQGDRIALRSDLSPEQASKVYTEEAMHSLENDLLGKNVEAAGDEGAIGRMLLNGEELSPEQLAALRSENDFRTVTLDGKSVQVEADDGGGGSDSDSNDVGDMDAEDVSANPGDTQDGIGQSPGEDIDGPGGNDSGSMATVQDAIKAQQHAYAAFGILANGGPPANVQAEADQSQASADAAQANADSVAAASGADSPAAQDAQDTADVAQDHADAAQDAADEAAENEANDGDPNAGVGLMSTTRVNSLISKATDAGIAQKDAERLVGAIQGAETRGERAEAYGTYNDTIRARPVDKLSDGAVELLAKRAGRDGVPQAEAEKLATTIGNAKTRGERSDAIEEYRRTILAHRRNEETTDGEAD